MDKIKLVINIISLLCLVNADNTRKFPQTISFGAGSSAYQIEGAWNEDGKSENIWDHWIHDDPSHIKNNDTADSACDMYNDIYGDGIDVAISKIQHYRFSIPWTRILPSGFADEVNIKAIMHYQNLLQILRIFNVTTVATLYYHDLPQSLQDIGGWTNPAMAKYFADYARVCFQYFPGVKYWITFNDPRATCRRGYGDGTFAPGVNSDGVGEYLCAYTVLKAHAEVYHIYKEEFKELTGKMSMAIDMQWSEPASANDTDAVERRNAFEFGLYANPIYKGNWPQQVIDRIDYRSGGENFTKSRLPKFTDKEIAYINGTSDFMAINLFYTNVVEDTEEAEFNDPSYMKDMKAKVFLNSNWSLAVNGQPIVPWSARKVLVWLKSSYNNPDIFITGNGIPDENTSLDYTRINYFHDYLNEILDAIIDDGVKVIGYTAYSLYDSFEWTDGYSIVNAEDTRKFPQTVSFGIGSSAYQIEGAWNEDGKSENIWDHWIHEDPSRIKNNDTADVACDAYNSTLNDVFYVVLSQVQHYRFSIPWTRILPTGFANEVNTNATTHYQEMIQNLGYFNITPIITLYYHDLPQSLQDIGGWTNPAMVKYFVEYARVCFHYFPNVQYWITFNDPRAICRKGYGDGSFAPGINSDGIAEYLCAYNVLKAHAAVYHLYKEEFKDLKGKISIAIDMQWSEPASKNDTAAVERRNAFEFGLYANPIYKGNWPQEVIDRVDYRSEKENFTKSRLPKFTEEEISYINGTSDFMAVNLFYTNVVEDTDEAEFDDPSYIKDMKVNVSVNSNWTLAVNGQPIVPLSARRTLVWLSSTYNSSDIFITGNGIPDENPSSDDTRVSYFRDYLNSILDAIIDDGVNVIGYTAYSLFDSFEWTDGYSYKFGFYYEYGDVQIKVNKDSLNFYKQVISTFTVPEEEITTSTTNEPHTTPDSAANIALCPALILTALCLFKLI